MRSPLGIQMEIPYVTNIEIYILNIYILNASPPLPPGFNLFLEILRGEKSSGASVCFGFDVVLGT